MAEHFNIIIVGAGPGGLSAAARAAEMGESHLLLEGSPTIANTISKFQKGETCDGRTCRSSNQIKNSF